MSHTESDAQLVAAYLSHARVDAPVPPWLPVITVAQTTDGWGYEVVKDTP